MVALVSCPAGQGVHRSGGDAGGARAGFCVAGFWAAGACAPAIPAEQRGVNVRPTILIGSFRKWPYINSVTNSTPELRGARSPAITLACSSSGLREGRIGDSSFIADVIGVSHH
jgi:hypothetical protein